MTDGTTTALLHVALAALAVGMVLQGVGAWKGVREHGWGAGEALRPARPPVDAGVARRDLGQRALLPADRLELEERDASAPQE
jgi:hypothetical protein